MSDPKPLIPTYSAVLEFIADFKARRQGLAPTIREIQAGCNYRSTQGVHYVLRVLEDRATSDGSPEYRGGSQY